ncbi:glycine betaine/L-proline ABC transporter ATP-binding protein [Pelagibacterium sp. 26DY04]|uniref:quaternary amine ABC transporter ATP-binding protein n=1 Tax=Pelagibacterium sp. 26DY04 TaxID=2967130 RepID=UPI00281660AC|nr:glycine betaine/L-proline ABC transporter ATP-binding protein [Pelagibacterium sp. 26DY04]WMT87645.1 glycine betaine/L-proline ABC transporter ATP-binding protein [Pelagibacterium sp. 26DY04]
MAVKLSVRNVYKIFGEKTDAALGMLEAGKSKEEILEATGATVGVRDASFDVGEGEIFVVMGLSGSGKSTLVRMLNGLIQPTSGSIMIDGVDVANCSKEQLRRIRREKIAMVFQHFALFPHWSVADNAAYGLKIKGVAANERREKALKALEQVGLTAWADSLPSELSGGMQQRVGLARGLATGPEVLLMDEPFGALDPLIRREMQDELIALQRSLKKTIIFITHDLNEALLLGDKIAIMKDGRFVQVGTAQEIVSNPADDYVAAFVADIDRGRVFTAEDVSGEAAPVKLGEASAEDAMRVMEDLNRNALYVVDDKDKVAGVVTYQDLAAATFDESKPDPVLEEVMLTDFPTAEADQQLADLYSAASAGLPIAVTDEKDRLVGVVEPEAVFAQLSGEDADAIPTETNTTNEKESAHV